MSNVTIRDVRAICTAPERINLIVVKVETSEPGLYGLGCATFAYRHELVADFVDKYLKPLLVGRDVADIEDLWEMMMHNSYWRNGPITNNAVSGVDMALWDIKGKMAGMPVYDLLGGKCRKAVPIYRHADGRTKEAVIERVQEFMEDGINHVRVQWGGYGGDKHMEEGASLSGLYSDPDAYIRNTVEIFDYARKTLGDKVELCHDVHERIVPIEAVRLAKRLEPYRLFFLEDAMAPEQCEYFRNIRQITSTPIAMGELFNNPKEWDYLIKERLIDFIRCHISQIGGITPAKKLAVLCEAFGVRTAWHGPGDVSPIGHAANVHLDMCSWNFGIQEWGIREGILNEVFPGCPVAKNGYVTVSDKPGLGVDIDEELAKKFPAVNNVTVWTQNRLPDGTFQRP
ncbi:MAG: starvation-sensing protein RspA [Clostridia bacterium]|nr:starvation-sensing protein RspA [Clostridia bacterium]